MNSPFVATNQWPGPSKRFFSDELHSQAWPDFLAQTARRRCIVAVFTILTVILDYITGPTIRFPAFYVLPILLMSWYEGFWPGWVCGAAIVLTRFGMEVYLWPHVPWPPSYSFINALTALTILTVISWFTALAGRLSREVILFWGLLPICVYCHRIRDENNQWQKLEAYVVAHSQASFTHGICPACSGNRTP